MRDFFIMKVTDFMTSCLKVPQFGVKAFVTELFQQDATALSELFSVHFGHILV